MHSLGTRFCTRELYNVISDSSLAIQTVLPLPLVPFTAEVLQDSEPTTASKTPKQQQKEGRLLLAEVQYIPVHVHT